MVGSQFVSSDESARWRYNTPARAGGCCATAEPLVEMMNVPIETMCAIHGIPKPVAEYRFHDTRRWRFDWAWPTHLLAMEIEGGAWTGGRHTRGKGFVNDLEKYAEAMCCGWRVLRVSPEHLSTGQACEWIKRILNYGVGSRLGVSEQHGNGGHVKKSNRRSKEG